MNEVEADEPCVVIKRRKSGNKTSERVSMRDSNGAVKSGVHNDKVEVAQQKPKPSVVVPAAVEKAKVSTKTEPPRGFDTKAARVSKVEKRKKLLAHLSIKADATTPASAATHPFDVDEADHCETPFQAYRDIEPFLFQIALRLKKPKEKLRIYDPYYCEGSVAKHLAKLGFTNVYNANEDFYACIDSGTVPEHDVLLTNPPYSGDHFKRILAFVGQLGKPWLLLLPNFVCRKSYYAPSIEPQQCKPLFLIPDPDKPYRYWAPGRKGFEIRAKGVWNWVNSISHKSERCC